MYQAGIPCLFVTGTGTNSSGTPESHAWNIVQVDGSYYLVDVTWDDPISYSDYKPIYYAYFNCTTEQFNRDHTAGDDNYPLPTCTATKANYFVHEGTVVDTFDMDQVVSFIKANKSVGEVHLYVKGNLSEYIEALGLFKKAGISSLQLMNVGQELILRFS